MPALARSSAEGSIFIFDPIPFRGGSKIATETVIRALLDRNLPITVMSADATSWNLKGIHKAWLSAPSVLTRFSTGGGFLLKHIIFALQIILYFLLHKRPRVLVGAAGPGTDFALHLASRILRIPVVQYVHGPVSPSRLVSVALRRTHTLFFLESARRSVLRGMALTPESLGCPRLRVFVNGIWADAWPSPSLAKKNQILWAASLLKWKGLEIFLAALERIPPESRPFSIVSYLRPVGTALDVSSIRTDIPGITWHEAPSDLDALRANCTIFVSTSQQEPFGLSILESLAAGLCVILPADGAYWDLHLVDGYSCRKFRPGDSGDLQRVIQECCDDSHMAARIGQNGQTIANRYRAEWTTRESVSVLSDPIGTARPQLTRTQPTIVKARAVSRRQ